MWYQIKVWVNTLHHDKGLLQRSYWLSWIKQILEVAIRFEDGITWIHYTWLYSVYNVCFLSYSDAFMYGIPNILPTYKREVKRNKWAPVRVYGYLTMSLPQPLTSHKLNWSSHIHTCTPILNEVTLLFPSDVQLC